MPKKYIIYRDGNCFIFEHENEDGTFDIETSVNNYNKVISELIKNGYTITYEQNKLITLTGKKAKRSTPTIISIIVDERLLKSKYLQPLKEDMKKVKKGKGYTLISTDENGKKKSVKYPGGLLKKIHDHAAVAGIAITLIGVLMVYGISLGRISLANHNDKKEISNEDKLTISMSNEAPEMPPSNADEASLLFSADIPTPWNITEDGVKIYPFQRSFLINEDYINNFISQNEGNTPNEVAEESNQKEEIVMSDPNEIEYNNYLKIYSEYFHLDSEKVIDFAKTITNNYTIPFEEINATTAYDLDSKEAACLIFVHNLNKDDLAVSLSDYGFSKDYFVSDPNITTLSPDKILSNGQTFEEFFGHVCDLLNVDKYWLLGITYLETGHIGSHIALTQNNFGGLRGKNGFYTYITPEAGIIAHCRNLKRYEGFGLNSMYELAGKYVFGNAGLIYEIEADPENPELAQYKVSLDNWVSSVKWFHNDFVARSEEVFAQDNSISVSQSEARVLK